MALSSYAKAGLRDNLQGAQSHDEGAEVAAAIDGAVQGVANGCKVARGTATLDGGNPTTVATGLTTITCAVVTLKAAATPSDDPTSFSVNYSGSDGNLDIYAYKTNGTDPTLVASTDNAATVNWIAFGT